MTIDPIVRERLMSYIHYSWCGHINLIIRSSIEQDDGSLKIPSHVVDEMRRLSSMNYDDLNDDERMINSIEAQNIIDMLDDDDVDVDCFEYYTDWSEDVL